MGVSVDGGGSNDMAVAFEGGTKFTDRLNQLAEAKAQHDAALAALQEGQAVKFSIQQADELTAKSKMEAEERISAAKAEADEIIRDARRVAQADSDQANGERNAAKREIAELRAAHDAYVTGARAEVDRLLAQAKADSEAAAQGRATCRPSAMSSPPHRLPHKTRPQTQRRSVSGMRRPWRICVMQSQRRKTSRPKRRAPDDHQTLRRP
jgi:hypothetical protein